MKGFKDSSNKFHPITDYKKGTRKSRDQKVKTEGIRLARTNVSSIKAGGKCFCGRTSVKGGLCPSCRDNGVFFEMQKIEQAQRNPKNIGAMERKARDESSYWSQKGKYQDEADVLNKLIPNEGESPDRNIDLFRRASNLYYEIFNNGGDNLEGEGNDFEVRRFENLGFDLPITNLLIEELNKVDDFDEPTGDRDKYFEGAQNEMDTLMDQVIEQIMESRKHA